jgi:hypothetical protein
MTPPQTSITHLERIAVDNGFNQHRQAGCDQIAFPSALIHMAHQTLDRPKSNGVFGPLWLWALRINIPTHANA